MSVKGCQGISMVQNPICVASTMLSIVSTLSLLLLSTNINPTHHIECTPLLKLVWLAIGNYHLRLPYVSFHIPMWIITAYWTNKCCSTTFVLRLMDQLLTLLCPNGLQNYHCTSKTHHYLLVTKTLLQPPPQPITKTNLLNVIPSWKSTMILAVMTMQII